MLEYMKYFSDICIICMLTFRLMYSTKQRTRFNKTNYCMHIRLYLCKFWQIIIYVNHMAIWEKNRHDCVLIENLLCTKCNAIPFIQVNWTLSDSMTIFFLTLLGGRHSLRSVKIFPAGELLICWLHSSWGIEPHLMKEWFNIYELKVPSLHLSLSLSLSTYIYIYIKFLNQKLNS